MNLRLSAWAIRNPIPVVVLMLGLLLAGITSFLGLPIKPFPDTSFPIVQVTVAQPGAAPREMVSQIVRPVESAIAGVQGVRTVQTQITPGVVAVTAEFPVGADVQRSLDDVRAAIDVIQPQLPGGIEPPTVQRLEMDSFPMVTYAVEAPGLSQSEAAWLADDVLVRRLMGVRGVAQVVRVGGLNREITVTLDPARMSALGITAGDVNSALSEAAVDATGGRGRIGDQEQAIRILGAVRSAEELADLDISLGNGRTVRLGEIARVDDAAAEPRGFALLNGKPVVALQVFKTKAASEVQVDDRVRAEIAAIGAERPDLRLTRLASTVEETRASYKATEHMLLEGMVLAALVVAFFLRDWRATLIAAVAMPLSLIPTFWVMSLLGFSLNIVSLLALTLVIGILVDDAIVEVENIAKRIARGETPYQAALIGADEIGLAVVAVTFTIVAVFLPVSALGGVVGQYFREFGITVSVAVLFSLLVARLVTPLLAAYFLTAKVKHDQEQTVPRWYLRLLDIALSNRLAAMAAGIAVFVASLGIASLLPTGFTPVGNKPVVFAAVEGPPGVTAEEMTARTRALTDQLRRDPAVESVFVTVGASGDAENSTAELRTGTVTILLKPRAERGVTAKEWQARVAPLVRATPDLRVSFLNEYGMPDVQIILGGEDEGALARAASALASEMRSVEGLAGVRLSSPPANLDLVIRLREAEAASLGVTAHAVAEAARVATIGELDALTPKLVDGDRRVPIRVKLSADDKARLDVIGLLPVQTSSGRSVPLSSVADLTFEPGVTRLDRFNRTPQITINAALDGITLGEATAAIEQLEAYRSLPEGVRHKPYGDAEYMAEMFAQFGGALGAGVLAMLAVLVLLFRDFFKPVTILMALPLSVGGAFAGLWATGMALDLPGMIGLLTLMGLVAKNSILLVEYAIEREREGMPARAAIVAACTQRARPIIMTTIAMIAGMLPTALGVGEGAEFRQPMAIAVIGGLITSTLLSLVLVPVMHLLVDSVERRIVPRLARLAGLAAHGGQPDRQSGAVTATPGASAPSP